jgi:surface polysaccharide O-acyltransferase-like enzyme
VAGEKRHIWYIDVLRVISAVGVIYMHTAASGLRAGVLGAAPYVTRGWHFMNLVTSFAFTAVPLFFMISGFLLFSDEKTQDVSYLFRHRLPRLLIPLAVWTLIYAAWLSFRSGEGAFLAGVLTRLRDALYDPVNISLWFLYALIILYILSPFLYAGLHALRPGGHKLVLGVIALVSLRSALAALLPDRLGGYLSLYALKSFQALGGNLLLMLLGWYLGNWEKRLPKAALWGAAAGTWLLIVIGTYVRTRLNGYYDPAFQTQSAGFEVLLASCVFLLAKQSLDRPSRLLRAVPIVPLTLPIYLMHALALLAMYHFVNPMRFPAIIGATLGVLIVCYLAAKTLASIRLLCFLFTGLRFEKASESCNWIYSFRRLRPGRHIK